MKLYFFYCTGAHPDNIREMLRKMLSRALYEHNYISYNAFYKGFVSFQSLSPNSLNICKQYK